MRGSPLADDPIKHSVMGTALPEGGKPGVAGQFWLAHGLAQGLPLPFTPDGDGDPEAVRRKPPAGQDE